MNTLSRTTASSQDAPATRIAQPSRSLYIKRGTPQFIQLTLALFSAGLATFALLYCVQPILPVLSADFGVSPAASSLSLSVSTGTMALGLLFTGPLSDAVGRKSVMVMSFPTQRVYDQLAGYSPDAGLYRTVTQRRRRGGDDLSQRKDPSQRGGLLHGAVYQRHERRYDRFILLADAVGCIGLMALLAALMFWRILPASRHFRPTSFETPQFGNQFPPALA